MENGNHDAHTLRHPEFQIDGRTGELVTGTRRVVLQPRVADLLVAIADRPGQLVTREELYERLWKGTHAEYRIGLDTAMKKLRSMLSLAGAEGVLVETLPRRGYRLLLRSQADASKVTDSALSAEHRERHGNQDGDRISSGQPFPDRRPSAVHPGRPTAEPSGCISRSDAIT
jgi:DNA-binding winged helix-turn-helix (wHTH) protein